MSAKKLASVGAQNYCEMLHWRRLACRAQGFTDGYRFRLASPWRHHWR